MSPFSTCINIQNNFSLRPPSPKSLTALFVLSMYNVYSQTDLPTDTHADVSSHVLIRRTVELSMCIIACTIYELHLYIWIGRLQYCNTRANQARLGDNCVQAIESPCSARHSMHSWVQPCLLLYLNGRLQHPNKPGSTQPPQPLPTPTPSSPGSFPWIG